MRKISIMIAIAGLICIILLAGCAKPISDVKTEDNIGKTVTVKGIVQNTVKIGRLSGYTVKDESGFIGVSSQSLPAEGKEITVKGVLMKDTLLGYYIKT